MTSLRGIIVHGITPVHWMTKAGFSHTEYLFSHVKGRLYLLLWESSKHNWFQRNVKLVLTYFLEYVNEAVFVDWWLVLWHLMGFVIHMIFLSRECSVISILSSCSYFCEQLFVCYHQSLSWKIIDYKDSTKVFKVVNFAVMGCKCHVW